MFCTPKVNVRKNKAVFRNSKFKLIFTVNSSFQFKFQMMVGCVISVSKARDSERCYKFKL